MLFNANNMVRVKLTKYGMDILKKKNGKHFLPKPDKDGWTRWQLWHLMSELGSYCGLGLEQPFSMDIDIEIPD